MSLPRFEMLPSLAEVRDAANLVHATLPATPQFCWPLLCERTGAEVWVKHENHQPIGAFKVRGGLVLLNDVVRSAPVLRGVITATRRNNGQSNALAVANARGRPAEGRAFSVSEKVNPQPSGAKPAGNIEH